MQRSTTYCNAAFHVKTSSRQLLATTGTGLVVAAAVLGTLPCHAAEPPRTPTPRPGSLAAYASGRQLDAPHGGPITITNETLREHSAGGALSTGVGHVDTDPDTDPDDQSDPGDEAPRAPADPAARRRWRREYARQSKAIARLERERAATESELDLLRRERMTPRTFAREDALAAELDAIDADLARERSALDRIVREARQDGAVPGWFRGL